jgi:hypothetical protein
VWRQHLWLRRMVPPARWRVKQGIGLPYSFISFAEVSGQVSCQLTANRYNLGEFLGDTGTT